jgi:serine/threonine protein kinase
MIKDPTPYVTGITIQEKLGGGNFGSVFKGNWNGNAVALKMLNKGSQQEFEKEVKLLTQLKHSNIVRCYGIYIEKDTSCILVYEES